MCFLLSLIRDALWSLPTVGILTGTGIYFTFKSRFYPIRKFFYILKSVKGEEKADGISPLKGLMTSLGGTVGVGSITGVAFAISEGGRGALFWMWISSFFCMMLKYAENYVTVKERPASGKGSAAVLLRSLGKRRTAVFFAAAGILASFGSGNMAQASAFSGAAREVGVSPTAAGIIFAVLLIPAVAGGQKIIAKINAFLVPVAGVIFLSAVTGIIIFRFTALPQAFSDIFRSALGIRQAGAGITGAAIATAMKTGVSKGVFSHEAGMGSSPIAHAATATTPEKAGSFGIIEVFADTFLVSTLTALALIVSSSESAEEMFFVHFGTFGGIILALSVGIFAYAAVISWCFYSESCTEYLFGSKRVPRYLYRITVIISAFSGCIWSADAVWQTADIFNALMLFPNLYAVILKRKEILF